MNKTEYKQSIAFHPGEYIKDLIEEMELSQKDFSKRLGVNEKVLSNLVNRKTSMNKDIAEKLATMMGTSVTVWLKLQLAYDAAILENRIDTEIKGDEAILNVLDYDYFVKLGVVRKAHSKEDKIRELRKYFSVASLNTLNNRDFLVNFKSATSKECSKNIICANAWVQTAINLARDIETPKYNSKKLKLYLSEIRKMMLMETNEFVPRIRETLKECGVALVFLPHLKNSGINGAVKWLNNDKAMLAINVYETYADVFWLSFFHELKHIFQHKTSKTFIAAQNNTEVDTVDIKLEQEADSFAMNSLITENVYNQFISKSIFTRNSIIDFADKVGIHPGIVVGRLQHDGFLDFKAFNDLRIKYQIKY